MRVEILKHLYDIREAALAISKFIQGKSFDDYQKDELLRSGVERKFEIMGEAMNRIYRVDADVLHQIRESRSIISFRNILAHAYDSIDNRIVWAIAEEDMGELLQDVDNLIESSTQTDN